MPERDYVHVVALSCCDLASPEPITKPTLHQGFIIKVLLQQNIVPIILKCSGTLLILKENLTDFVFLFCVCACLCTCVFIRLTQKPISNGLPPTPKVHVSNALFQISFSKTAYALQGYTTISNHMLLTLAGLHCSKPTRRLIQPLNLSRKP